jgi:hypothetical protein
MVLSLFSAGGLRGGQPVCEVGLYLTRPSGSGSQWRNLPAQEKNGGRNDRTTIVKGADKTQSELIGWVVFLAVCSMALFAQSHLDCSVSL